MKKCKLIGFTLAEVLITLGVIGVVAALTIPTLINSYEKKATVTRLQKIYAELTESLRMAEVEHGEHASWVFEEDAQGPTEDFMDNYLLKNIKTIKKCYPASTECWTPPSSSDGTKGYLSNGFNYNFSAIIASGYSIFVWASQGGEYPTHAQIWVDIDGPFKGKNQLGRDVFGFITLVSHEPILDFTNYGSERSNIIEDDVKEGCNKNATGSLAGISCGALIKLDGWEIRDDYPW